MKMTFWFRHDDGFLAVVLREWRRNRSCGLDHRRGDSMVAATHIEHQLMLVCNDSWPTVFEVTLLPFAPC